MPISAERLAVIEEYPTISDTVELVAEVKALRALLKDVRPSVDDFDTLNRVDAAIRGEVRPGLH